MQPTLDSPGAALQVAAGHAELSAEIGRWLVHDLRGPLQGVTLTLALLAESEPPPFDDPLRDALTGASAELGAVVDLLDELLRMPQMDAPLEPVSLGAAIGHAERVFARRRVRLAVAWPDPAALAPLPPVRAAPGDLLHVLLSLLLAATRAAGGTALGRIEVAVAADGPALAVAVTAHPPAGAEPPPWQHDARLDSSRALLERAGGELAIAPAPAATRFTARLRTWNSGE